MSIQIQSNLSNTEKGDDRLLYENIKRVASDKGYSISKIESNLKLGKAVISKWNKNRPSVDKVALVAEFLDVPIETLIQGDIRGRDDE